MKSSIPVVTTTWHAAETFGACFVVGALAFIGVTLWLGWPVVSTWLGALW
jgi:hypothetical protein